MVTLGVTVMELPVKLPGTQAYVVAPLAVMVVLAPTQIVAAVALVLRVGSVFTVMVVLAVLVQPLASLPVTV